MSSPILKTNEDILKGHWKEIAGKVRRKFASFTDDDIESIKGSYEEFEGKLRKIYGYKKAEAQQAIDDFLNSENWENLKDSLVRNAHNIKERAEEFVSHSVDDIKDKMHSLKDASENAQENVIQYVKENPVKSLGIALLAGVITGVLLKKK